MKDYKLTVDSFAVSWAMDTFRNGEKSNNFVSVTVRSDPPVELEDLPLVQAKVALQVSASVIHDALARMAITEDEARSKISDIKENFQALEKSILKARENKEKER